MEIDCLQVQCGFSFLEFALENLKAVQETRTGAVDGRLGTHSVVLPLNGFLRFCGFGRHLQPAGGACFQLFDLPDRGRSLTSLHTLHSDSRSGQSRSHLHGDVFAEELDSVLLHVVPSAVGHVLVEAPQQDGAHHDGDIQTQAGQEAPTLQGHVGRPDHQGLPRAVGQREEVIAGGRKADLRRVEQNTAKRWRLSPAEQLTCL